MKFIILVFLLTGCSSAPITSTNCSKLNGEYVGFGCFHSQPREWNRGNY